MEGVRNEWTNRRINGSETDKKGMEKGRDGGTEKEEWMEGEM